MIPKKRLPRKKKTSQKVKAEVKTQITQEPKPRTYDDVAKRVLAAIEEFNNALFEAYKRQDMHVYIGTTPEEQFPMQLACEVYKRTDASRPYEMIVDNEGVQEKDQEKEWRFLVRAKVGDKKTSA